MVALNQLQKELVAKGLAEIPKERKTHNKQFKCHRCGSSMIQVEGTNTMACTNCNQYFIFDKKE